MHGRQWESQLIREFFLVIDWMMALPDELELKLEHFVVELEQEQKMEYISSIERIRLARIKQEGKLEMLSRLLMRRFGSLPQAVLARLNAATQGQIEDWFDRGMDAATLDEVFMDRAN